LVAGAFGGIFAMCYMWFVSPGKKPDPSMSVNGMLAGLVAVTAPCAFVDSIGAAIIGAVAGVLVCLASVWLEKAKIDDPVGAVPVHFVNGMWGVLSVGLFAKGLPESVGWNGMSGAVTGLFYGGGVSQLMAQGAEAVSIAVAVTGLSYVFWKILASVKQLRVDPAVEVRGLDIPEMGTHGYFGDEFYVPGAPSPAKMPVNMSGAAAVAK
jgi:ammonium transporter, Amt family